MSSIKTVLFLICCVASSPSMRAQGYFELTDDVRDAYHTICQLKLEEGQRKIDRIKALEPDNLMAVYVENYIDFFTLFIGEKESDYDRLQDNKDKRIKRIERGDKSSPYYRYCIAEVNLQWATARLKFGERLTPMQEVYKAYKLLEENQEIHPSFEANKKSLSIIHALGENIPGLIRTIFKVEGSIEKGTQEIADLVAYSDRNKDFMWRDESYAIYAYILFYQNNQKQKAYDLLHTSDLDIVESPLLCFLFSNIAQKTGHNEEAITILEGRPRGAEYYPFYYLDFMYGKFLMYKLDAVAIDHMLTFVEYFEGKHFVKEAYQKLAWYALATQDDLPTYKKYMSLCLKKGDDLIDEDKQAQKEAKKKMVPNSILLQARLLYDGGYFQKAQSLLIRKAHLFTQSSNDNLEFNYRMGRISQALGNPMEAVDYFLKTIVDGEKSETYFACNAALQTALIFENQKAYTKSLQMYKRCLGMKPNEYKTSLHQKAKSGMERIEEARKNN